jgi:hypothetical protein
METEADETSQRPLLLIIGGVAVLLILAAIAVGVFLLLRRPAIAPFPTDYVGQTACDHPFFPLRQGARWHYAGDIAVGDGRVPATEIWRVEQVHGDTAAATAIVVIQYQYTENTPQVIETIAYTCTPEGITRDSLIVRTDSQSVTDYTLQSGAYLLPSDQLVQGAAWQHLYNAVTNYAPPGTDYAWSYEAEEVETIDNTAGTFDALRVAGARSEPAGNDSSTEWFAFGVGPVQSERVQNEGGVDVVSTMMLTSYTLPGSEASTTD